MNWISPLRGAALGLALGFDASAAPPSTPLDPASLGGLAHLWRCDGNGADAIGAENLTVSPRIGIVPGVRGQAFRLPGTVGVVAGNDRPSLSGFSSSFTTVLWVKPGAARVATPESTRGVAGISGQQYVLFPSHGGFGLEGGAGSGISVGTNGVTVAEHREAYLPTPLVWNGDLNGWVHLAVVYDRNVPSLYVNGAHVHTGLDTNLRSAITPGNIYPSKTLGSPYEYGAFQGDVDEVAIFSRALSPGEIALLAGAPDPSPPAPPKLLNVNFGTDHTPARSGPAAFGLGSQDFWNRYSRDDGSGGFRNQGTLENLLWSDGAASGVNLRIANAPGAWANGHPDVMFGIYLYPLGGTQVVVDLQQLPVGRYTLYAYGHGGPPDNQNTVFNLRASGMDYGDRATAADASWRSSAWKEGAHYVRFTNVLVGPERTMTLTAKPGASSQA
ncbi:MAG: LamG domain-containing protein [Verrucomicrobiota bacterium]